MRVEDIAKTAVSIAGTNWDDYTEEEQLKAVEDVKFIIGATDITAKDVHLLNSEEPYKTVKPAQKTRYNTIIATVKSLSALKSDEKGDFVEGESIEVIGKNCPYPNGIDWSDPDLGLKTVSTPKDQTEGM